MGRGMTIFHLNAARNTQAVQWQEVIVFFKWEINVGVCRRVQVGLQCICKQGRNALPATRTCKILNDLWFEQNAQLDFPGLAQFKFGPTETDQQQTVKKWIL